MILKFNTYPLKINPVEFFRRFFTSLSTNEEYGERSTFESHTYLKIYLVMLKGLDAVLNNKKKKNFTIKLTQVQCS